MEREQIITAIIALVVLVVVILISFQSFSKAPAEMKTWKEQIIDIFNEVFKGETEEEGESQASLAIIYYNSILDSLTCIQKDNPCCELNIGVFDSILIFLDFLKHKKVPQ